MGTDEQMHEADQQPSRQRAKSRKARSAEWAASQERGSCSSVGIQNTGLQARKTRYIAGNPREIGFIPLSLTHTLYTLSLSFSTCTHLAHLNSEAICFDGTNRRVEKRHVQGRHSKGKVHYSK